MAALGASPSDYDYLLKIIMVGDSGVGKSALLKSFMGEEFSKHYVSTIGVDFEIKQVVMLSKKVHLQIWDTAGQERFRTITTSYYRSSDAILVVFDTSESSSFKNVAMWLDNLREYARKDVDIVLVGNKVDLESERQVSYEVAKSYADEIGLPYIETSAKTSHNVIDAFNVVAMSALRTKITESQKVMDNTPNVDMNKGQDVGNRNRSSSGNSSSSGGCC